MHNHTDSERPILVFGATGRQGGSVARALRRANRAVRAFVRDAEAPQAAALRDLGVELAQGSFADADSVRAAMQGVHGVFSVQPGSPGGSAADDKELRAGITIADMAAGSGIAHLVYSSGASVGEKLTGIARFDNKPRIEAHIRGLPVTATILRPAIFMEALLRPGFGLNEDRFTFLLRPEQSMQLIAVSDIGKFAAAVFADTARFAGATLKIAGDTVTGRGLESAFSEAAGRIIRYSRFPDDALAASPDLQHMAVSLESGPLADHVDLARMRSTNPELLSFREWLAGSGHKAFEDALRAPRS